MTKARLESIFACRTFKIRLKRDRQVYAPDLVIENSTGRLHYDTSRAYVGFLEGGSTVFTSFPLPGLSAGSGHKTSIHISVRLSRKGSGG